MVELVLELTTNVVTVKVAEFCPAETVTLAGTVAAEVFEDDRLTLIPPVGAGPLMFTVPVELAPPTTVVGFNDSAVAVGARTVILACAVPFKVAVMMAVVSVATAEVVMVKVAEVAPLGTLTEAGTEAAEGLELDKSTVSPFPKEMLTVP